MVHLGRVAPTRRDPIRQDRQRMIRRLGAIAAVPLVLFGAGVTAAGRALPSSTGPAGAALTIVLHSPRAGASYPRGARIVARFRCREPGMPTASVACRGSVPSGHAIDTRHAGAKTFTVTATDASGASITKTVHYTVWTYVNPLRAMAGLQA